MINSWEAYFIFSGKERKGIIVLGVILTLSMVITFLVPNKNGLVGKTSPLTIPTLHLFKFDPNTIDSANAIQLGIPIKQVNTLMHYREKGGRFYKKEDILKLYGLDPVIAHQLIPFIELKSTENLSKRGGGDILQTKREIITNQIMIMRQGINRIKKVMTGLG
jgi:competence protein ComEA